MVVVVGQEPQAGQGLHRRDSVFRGEGDGGNLQHGDVIFVVAHAVNVLGGNAQMVGKPADAVALGHAFCVELEEDAVAEHALVMVAPAAVDEVLGFGEHLVLLLDEHFIPVGLGHIGKLALLEGDGQMVQVRIADFVGMDDKKPVVGAVKLHGEGGKFVQ